MMSEKVRAGILFKGKKSLYEQRLDQTHTHCLRSLSLSPVYHSHFKLIELLLDQMIDGHEL